MQLFGAHYDDDDDGGGSNKEMNYNEAFLNTFYTTYNGNEVDDYVEAKKSIREDDDDSFGKCNGKRSNYYNYYFYNHNAHIPKLRSDDERDRRMRNYEEDNGEVEQSNSVVDNINYNEGIDGEKGRIIMNIDEDEFFEKDGINVSSTYKNIEELNQFLTEEITRQAQTNESFIHISKTSNAGILNNKEIKDDVGNSNANKPTITIENIHKNEL